MADQVLRSLRKNMTEAERRLWSRLRKEALGYDFRRQHRLGGYIVDFVCLERRLVVEVDGGQHNMPPGLARDARRTEWLEADGYEVLRFWNNDVLARTGEVVETIWHALRKPRPGLPPIRTEHSSHPPPVGGSNGCKPFGEG